MRELSGVTDFFVIVTAANSPHIKALADDLERHLKKEGVKAHRHAGTPESQWMVADYFDVVVHLFTQDLRDRYSLERLWNDAPRVED